MDSNNENTKTASYLVDEVPFYNFIHDQFPCQMNRSETGFWLYAPNQIRYK